MSHQLIVKDIKLKSFGPVYFLHGPEPFFIEYLERYFTSKVIPAEESDFNQHVLYAKDHELGMVIKLAQQFPMMGERQLILVKEAQHYKNFDELIKYLKKPLVSTVLVFCYKGKKLDARVEKKLASVKFMLSKPLYDNQVPDWIKEQVTQVGLTIEPQATVLLSEYLGNDLSKIRNELSKLKIVLPKGALISADVIEKNIGISKEFNVFELVKAVANRNHAKTLTIANHFSKNTKNHPFVVTISTLYNFFSKVMLVHFAPSSSPDVLAKVLKVNRFFIQDYQTASLKYNRKEVAENIHVLAEYDLKSKGVHNVSVGEGELIKEMVLKLLH
jgi:DNA polymerase III subunit delta